MNQLEILLARIDDDLILINDRFDILSQDQLSMLYRDIKYVFLDNIAKEIRLVFYDPATQNVYWENKYTRDGSAQSEGDINSNGIKKELVFDVFIDFTHAFLNLHANDRKVLLNNTELDWFT